MLFVLCGELTGVDPTVSAEFLYGAEEALAYAGTSVAKLEDHLAAWNPGPSDGVIFFNPSELESVPNATSAFLERAATAGAVLLPIALDEGSRQPPSPATEQQSFDVVDHLRRRSLPTSFIHPAAEAFAREAISRVQPTCSRDRLRLFICHRRQDGEGLAAWLDRALSVRHEHVFRDLIEIQTGDVAEDRIDEALETADAIIFLDTPLAGESDWVRHELVSALARRIPTVWIRVGDEDGRTPLRTKPTGEPHLRVEQVDDSDQGARLADAAVACAFRLSRSQVARALDTFHDFRSWAVSNDVTINALDQRRMIFEARFPQPENRYARRPRVDLLQVFGRQPTDEDARDLTEWLDVEGWSPHERECRPFDAMVMLTPGPSLFASLSDWMSRDSSEAYLTAIGARLLSESEPRALAILGAFPSDVENHQDIISAVGDVAAEWLSLGGTVVMGGHPTFTPIILGAAQQTRPNDGPDATVVYQSRFFANEESAAWLAGRAQVVLTESTGARDSSLTLMRREMLGRVDLVAAVCVGGRTDEGGSHHPGVDEEIALAVDRGVPVILVATPGGRAAELAIRTENDNTWPRYAGSIDGVLVRQLSLSAPYREVARRLWSALGFDH